MQGYSFDADMKSVAKRLSEQSTGQGTAGSGHLIRNEKVSGVQVPVAPPEVEVAHG
jgi:hypothetical protein